MQAHTRIPMFVGAALFAAGLSLVAQQPGTPTTAQGTTNAPGTTGNPGTTIAPGTTSNAGTTNAQAGRGRGGPGGRGNTGVNLGGSMRNDPAYDNVDFSPK